MSTTTSSKLREAHNEHFSTFTTKPKRIIQNHTPSNEPDHHCDTVHDWAGHDVGLSRWARQGDSYRTIQRFFYTVIPWALRLSDGCEPMVERILTLHKQLAAAKTPTEKTFFQRQIETTDREIDRLVYELYGLTEEEIRIVEGG